MNCWSVTLLDGCSFLKLLRVQGLGFGFEFGVSGLRLSVEGLDGNGLGVRGQSSELIRPLHFWPSLWNGQALGRRMVLSHGHSVQGLIA
jgi:hypothetical protein